MSLNLLSEGKSVSAGSLFHVLTTRSQKKVVRITTRNRHTQKLQLAFQQ